jgi:tRNA pseudouridine38-40 synthase
MGGSFRLVIEYDGTDFHGWQRQKGDRTVQGEIEGALETITGRRVPVTGAGRTDAGVHAEGQVAHIHCPTALSAEAIQNAINGLTGDDLVVRSCTPVPETFHSRFDARGKTYRYRINNAALPSPLGRRFEWWVRTPLDRSAMRVALSHLIGTHDFSAFEGAGSPRAHSVRTVTDARIDDNGGGRITFTVSADGFLRYMVRNLVGTLVAVGSGKLSADGVAVIRDGRDRTQAPATAPPHGLCLVRVDYG